MCSTRQRHPSTTRRSHSAGGLFPTVEHLLGRRRAVLQRHCIRSSPRSTPGCPTPAVFQSISARHVSPSFSETSVRLKRNRVAIPGDCLRGGDETGWTAASLVSEARLVTDSSSPFLDRLHRTFGIPVSIVMDLVDKATHHRPVTIDRVVDGYDNEVYRADIGDRTVFVRIKRFGEEPTFDGELWAMAARVLLASRPRRCCSSTRCPPLRANAP